MNPIFTKAILEQVKKEQQQNDYAQKFNALENRYRKGVEDAYGLSSADEWQGQGWGGRAANVATSIILDALGNSRVARGRSAMTATNPLLVSLLRSQGFKDAFQGAAEAKMQLPDESDPRAVLNYFDALREAGGIPYNNNDPRIRRAENAERANEVQDILSKYGY